MARAHDEASVKVFDQYGVWEADVEAAILKLEPALGIPFKPHNSTYLGGDYYLAKHQGGELALRPNYLDFTKSWVVPEHKAFRTLLLVSNIQDPDAVQRLLKERCGGSVVWLRRDAITGRKSELLFKLEGLSV
ncbi:hypothetical protein [Corallococcus terminator]|uniref:Uncharacterized protein n=1 Tax=Corallococcus terminator TaxID=2316733 RepID=A0A3A8HN51_9BACT|nr:hypothetical protein [Corallococcus terminator]RKG71948.1 hypothetical protein D7V88_38925 [Corallococcus terminator]